MVLKWGNIKEVLALASSSAYEPEHAAVVESIKERAYAVKRQYFGDTISLYAPLYLSNFCENHCRYCGFQNELRIARKKLTEAEIGKECEALAKAGLQSVLLLTGDSRHQTPPSYLQRAVAIARGYFPHIALEVYPLALEEYEAMRNFGVDGVTIYQETYNRTRYEELHTYGPKRDFYYRLHTPDRIAQAGIRQISIGVLLGLADWCEDITALFSHLRELEKKYPGIEYSLSFPRLRRVSGDSSFYAEVGDAEMLLIIAVARLLFPRVGINLSTRESASFRDAALLVGITRISAGSSTVVGGYTNEEQSEGQFTIDDSRSLAQIKAMLHKQAIDPMLTDWRAIVND
jgi:2-iminoacetate synthase